jgi:uncharacterized protein (TIGR02217 family)
MASDFHEVRFPLDVALGRRGGPGRRTDIVTLASDREQRNSRWAHARRRYDAGLGVRTLDALHAVVAFFEERRGRLYGFRFHDRVDGKSCAPSGTPARPTSASARAMARRRRSGSSRPTAGLTRPMRARSPSRSRARSGWP